MALIKVPVRYLSMQSSGPEDNVESNIRYTETVWEIAAEEAALVLVDVWNKHHIKTHLERSFNIITNKIAPVMKAARKAGVTIIHAPSPEIAKKYPQSRRYGEGQEAKTVPEPSDWPPTDFRKRIGRYAHYARLPTETPPYYKGPFPEWWHWDDIADAAKPEPDDFVVATGSQLHTLLKDRRILHLFYAGFATNICVQHRDYGMIAMNRRGYNLILLRDCTTGIETYYTVEGLLTTKIAIQQIEWSNSSTTSEDFIEACEASLRHHE